MQDHAKPTIREINPENIIPHVRANDLKSEKSRQPDSKFNNRTCEFSKE